MDRRSFFFFVSSVRTAADYCRLGLTNRYFDNDNHPKIFLSGSLHFGIKFYCSDEDESSKLLFFCFERSYDCTAADTLCRTVGWD